MSEKSGYSIAVLGSKTRRTRELVDALKQECEASDAHISVTAWDRKAARPVCDLLIVDLVGQSQGRPGWLIEYPGLHPDLRVIAIVKPSDVSTAVAAMKAGAEDCLEMPLQVKDLFAAVVAVLKRKPPLNGRSSGRPVLTKMETSVLRMILSGLTNRAIASQLCRSPRTIESHRRNMMHKLGAVGTADLVRRVLSLGL